MAKTAVVPAILYHQNQYLAIFRDPRQDLQEFQHMSVTPGPCRGPEAHILRVITWTATRSPCRELYTRGNIGHRRTCSQTSISCHPRGSILGKLCGFMWTIIISRSDVELICLLECSTVFYAEWVGKIFAQNYSHLLSSAFGTWIQ